MTFTRRGCACRGHAQAAGAAARGGRTPIETQSSQPRAPHSHESISAVAVHPDCRAIGPSTPQAVSAPPSMEKAARGPMIMP